MIDTSTPEGWAELEEAWVEYVVMLGTAEAACRMMREARKRADRALRSIDGARTKTTHDAARARARKAQERLAAACEEAEWWLAAAGRSKDRAREQGVI